jgi:hypothetical protein
MSNNLNAINFDKNKKRYEFDGMEFTLKAPYMYIVKESMSLMKEIEELSHDLTKLNNDEFWRLADLQLQLLKLVLDETEKGKLDNLRADRLRPDVMGEIFADFFQRSGK